MIRLAGIGALAALLGTVTADASAQVFTPTYMGPDRTADVGVYVSDGPGNFGIEGIWRRNLGGYDLGFRAGLADVGDLVLLVGAELRSPLELPDVPLQIALTGGLQGAMGGASAAGFQGGATIGYPIVEPGFTLVPYIHPRIALLTGFRDDDFELNPLADIGFDFVLPQGIAIRIGFGLARETASWGLGFAWR